MTWLTKGLVAQSGIGILSNLFAYNVDLECLQGSMKLILLSKTSDTIAIQRKA